jgi:hypothetical protein
VEDGTSRTKRLSLYREEIFFVLIMRNNHLSLIPQSEDDISYHCLTFNEGEQDVEKWASLNESEWLWKMRDDRAEPLP